MNSVSLDKNILTANEYLILLESVGWDAPPYEQAGTAIENSLYTVLIKTDGVPIGMGRVCGDGAIVFYFKDIVVMPEFQRKGIGKMIVNNLIEYVKSCVKEDWCVYAELMTGEPNFDFYSRFGFQKRLDDSEGKGMILWMNK